MGTFFIDTSLEGAGMSRVSPDSWFSDNVDIFFKNPHQKILSFRKVTGLYILGKQCQQKGSFAFEMSSQPRGDIHI